MARRPAPKPARRGRGRPEPKASGPGELRLPVWQFVRLMVQTEESLAKRRDGGAAALSDAWGGVWQELDAALSRLGSTDSQGFADLMMDQEVVLEVVTPALLRAAEQEISKVVRSMRQTLAAGVEEGQRVEDLQFEIAELETTLKGLTRR